MIYSSHEISTVEVAEHYNDLDHLYRRVWGEHVHHGWFRTGKESKEDAALMLSQAIGELLSPQANHRICDIGCGYGATSRFLSEKYKASVVGVTISEAQWLIAKQYAKKKSLEFSLMDWLQNDFKNESFDHLISVESSEHMPDKNKFFTEAHRVLKPEGKFVICAWLASEKPSLWERRMLLEPICQEGRLPSMGKESEYRRFLQDSGFELQSFIDISDQVKRTWTLSIFYLCRHMIQEPRDLKFLFSKFNKNAEFLKTLFRIRFAYETGAMRYGIFKAVKR